eukprot:2408045-Amphidinium_carterae.2
MCTFDASFSPCPRVSRLSSSQHAEAHPPFSQSNPVYNSERVHWVLGSPLPSLDTIGGHKHVAPYNLMPLAVVGDIGTEV